MPNGKSNGRVTLAVLQNSFNSLKEDQKEIKNDVKDIRQILLEGSGKIAENRASIASIWKVFGIIATALSVFITLVAALK